MSKLLYRLIDRVPVQVENVLEWAIWFEDCEKIVAIDILPDGTRVSTVFLGINMSHWPEHLEVFETVIFTSGRAGDYDRYATWEQAEKGHRAAVRSVTQKVKAK
jgi:hypothetical protein